MARSRAWPLVAPALAALAVLPGAALPGAVVLVQAAQSPPASAAKQEPQPAPAAAPAAAPAKQSPAAQDPAAPARAPQGPSISDAFAAWFAAGAAPDANKPLLAALAAAPVDGLCWLSAAHAGAADDPARRKAIEQAERDFALAFLKLQRATNITFRGQYEPLAMLQPRVGEFFFTLLLEPPDWFPTTQRIELVPALRDLQPRIPAAARVDAIVRLADDERREPEPLRRALAALLWQWDLKEQGQREIARLTAETADGAADDRLAALLALADFHNQLREHKAAAATYRAAMVLAKASKLTLKPLTWYSAACVHALAGDVERGLAAVEQCVNLLASPDLDSSLRLQRAMFDTDPELAALRGDPRFAAALQRAFPPAAQGR